MTVIESILKDLETLPASKLVEVAHYVSRFNPKRRDERMAALKATAGCLAALPVVGVDPEVVSLCVCRCGRGLFFE